VTCGCADVRACMRGCDGGDWEAAGVIGGHRSGVDVCV